jgi:Asp-tRNA(Asn)/Glu-tRNA(Gln) amidotransferase A subunit family amidase
MPDPLSLSARAAAREIAAGRLTAEALAAACLDRIAAREEVVGAWRYLDREAALAAARRCDASPPSGPLHGIPIAVKDLMTPRTCRPATVRRSTKGIGRPPTPPASPWRAAPAPSCSARR